MRMHEKAYGFLYDRTLYILYYYGPENQEMLHMQSRCSLLIQDFVMFDL